MKLSNKIVIEKAKELGFDLVGFASAELLQDETERLKEWLALGYHASMEYMNRNVEKRLDVKKCFTKCLQCNLSCNELLYRSSSHI